MPTHIQSFGDQGVHQERSGHSAFPIVGASAKGLGALTQSLSNLPNNAGMAFLGLREIKAVTGIIFAQDKKTARHEGMPHGAVESDCVDFILPPDEIARCLAKIGQSSYLSYASALTLVSIIAAAWKHAARTPIKALNSSCECR